MPLITPGQYDFSLNQKFLLEKLYKIDILNNYLFLFIGSIVAIIIIIPWVVRSHKRLKRDSKELDYETQKYTSITELDSVKKLRELKHIAMAFSAVCEEIYTDLNELNHSKENVIERYSPAMKTILLYIKAQEESFYINYPHLIKNYEKYKKLFKGI